MTGGAPSVPLNLARVIAKGKNHAIRCLKSTHPDARCGAGVRGFRQPGRQKRGAEEPDELRQRTIDRLRHFEKGQVRIHYEEVGSAFPRLVIPSGGINFHG